jgi:hypothetical protein
MEITLNPTIKQHYAYQIIDNNNVEYIHLLFGGAAGGGKSWFGSEWLINNCVRYPGTKWFIGREELKRLRDSTLITFYKVCRSHNIRPNIHFKYNGQDNHIIFYNGSRIDLLDLRYMPSDPMYERYGSLEFTGGWIEEGGEVKHGAYDTLKSRINRWMNDQYGLNGKLLITCNPKKNWLYSEFYKLWRDGTLPETKGFIQSLIDDNPHNEKGYKRNLMSITDRATKERLLLGNWEYDDDPAQLIEYDNIINLFSNSFVDKELFIDNEFTGDKYIIADIARHGRDKTVIGVWNGSRLEYIKTLERNKVTEAAELIEEIRNSDKIPLGNVLIDEDGIGGGVVDILECKGFINNSKPFNEENYNNLKSQCGFQFANKVNNHEYYINPKGINIADKEAIIEELEQIKKDKIGEDGKQCIVPKKKVIEAIGRSPDYSDMLIMREYFDMEELTTSFSLGSTKVNRY